MKQILVILIGALVIVGCGKKDAATEPEAKTNPKQTEPKTAGTNTGVEKPSPAMAFTNSLGMVFKPVPGTKVQFCIWETRVKDYAAYAAANAGVDGSWKEPPYFKEKEFKQSDTHPVVDVSWEDAAAFCAWLTRKERAEGKISANQSYRLPTDAEWSVAVGLGKEKGNTPKEKQLGVTDVYPWGTEWPPPKGAGNYHESLKVDKFGYTTPVGSFAANQHGLHDLAGNVWEWCEDWYDPTAPKYRVLRGASWLYIGFPDSLLSSFRDYDSPDTRFSNVGFRCVLVGE
tara:strand:- start:360 stop:1217 length:858 start_codon:yes stop_codon:yes gene_type:complete